MLGLAILCRKRRADLQLTGAIVLGTAMLLMSLLALLEFALKPPRAAIDELSAQAAGWSASPCSRLAGDRSPSDLPDLLCPWPSRHLC